MENFYDQELIKELTLKREKLEDRIQRFRLSYPSLELNSDSYEYFFHGYLRRLNLIQECIHNIYKICPIDCLIKGGSKDKSLINNITINLQTIIINVAGCLDNLVRFYVDQKGCNAFKNHRDYTFFGSKFKKNVSEEFRKNINHLDETWNKPYFKQFRDGLAHRVPLFVPPYFLYQDDINEINNKYSPPKNGDIEAQIAYVYDTGRARESIGHFRPIMQGSFKENGYIPFHQQILKDCEIVVELGERVFDELALSRNKYDQSIFDDIS